MRIKCITFKKMHVSGILFRSVVYSCTRYLVVSLEFHQDSGIGEDIFEVIIQVACMPDVSLRILTHDAGAMPEEVSYLQWRHNGHGGVSNHQPYDCLLNRIFRRRSKKTSKLHFTGLCVGNSPVTGEFCAQKASDAENISIWWRHHVYHGSHNPSCVHARCVPPDLDTQYSG